MERKTWIKVPHGVTGELGKLFRCCLPYVRYSLRGERDTQLARRIRRAAMEKGGKEYEVISD
jgi:hypothetical protein